MQNKVTNIMNRMRRWYGDIDGGKNDGLGVEDWEYFETLAKCYLENGWKEDDIVAYFKLTEEFNPELEEDVALRRMAKITEKYWRN